MIIDNHLVYTRVRMRRIMAAITIIKGSTMVRHPLEHYYCQLKVYPVQGIGQDQIEC